MCRRWFADRAQLTADLRDELLVGVLERVAGEDLSQQQRPSPQRLASAVKADLFQSETPAGHRAW